MKSLRDRKQNMCIMILRYWKMSLVLLVFLVFRKTTHAVKINKLQVPDVIPRGSPVVLDCDYTLEAEAADGLVVKWFFNQRPTPIYQWIPSRRPQDFGILKGRLNLDYSASDDSNSMHRALHIIHPVPDLTGEYTCLVSTFETEDRQSKRMLVFAPQRNIELKQKVFDQILQVLCIAEGVFPAPTMNILAGDSEVNGSVVTIQERAGLFNIKATANISALAAPEEFSCELHIPQANYTVKIEAMYYPENAGNSLNKPVVEFMLLMLYVTRLVLGVHHFQ